MSQVSSRLAQLRQDHRVFTHIQELSGWGYDSKTGLSTTTDAGKTEYLQAHPEAEKFSERRMPGFEILDSMWRNTQAIGSFATSGVSSSSRSSILHVSRDDFELEDEDRAVFKVAMNPHRNVPNNLKLVGLYPADEPHDED